MAENRETAILDVQLDAGKVAQDLSDLLQKIAALKDRQKELNVAIADIRKVLAAGISGAIHAEISRLQGVS